MKRPTSNIPAEVISINQIVVESKLPSGLKKEIAVLSEQIKENGLVYPIVVATGLAPGPAAESEEGGKESSKKEKEVYRLKAGQKRLEAAKLAGWREIKAVVIPPIIETLALEDRFTTLIEKCQRKELSDYDIAQAAVDLEEKHEVKGTEFARVMGISQGYTYNLMRWFKAVPQEIRTAWKNDHPLLNQTELETISHMQHGEGRAYWEKRLKMHHAPEPFQPGKGGSRTSAERKSRRPTETQLIKFLEAIDETNLIDPVKELLGHVVRFSLGVSKNVPGITDYRKLHPSLIKKDAKEKDAGAKEVAA